jgi:predicted glycosyltransferase
MKIWIDMTNSPHVMFFEPIIRSLEEKHDVITTARDYQQTLALLKEKGIPYTLLGKHHGKSITAKIKGLYSEVAVRMKFIKDKNPDLTITHQSYYATLAARLSGKKSLYIFDGDGAILQMLGIFFGSKALAPEKLPAKIKGVKIAKYPGLKEEVYISGFIPDESYLSKLGLDPDKSTILIRPEAGSASYIKKENVLGPLLDSLDRQEKYQVILLPRTSEQMEYYKKAYPNFLIPDGILSGPDLAASVDLVISGGGTMNREAVVFGTPVISAFQNPPLTIDKWLIEEGYMDLINEPDLQDVEHAIERKKRYPMSSAGKDKILEHIEQMLQKQTK